MKIKKTTPVRFGEELRKLIILLDWSPAAIEAHARRVLAESGPTVAGFDISIDSVGLMAAVDQSGTINIHLCDASWEPVGPQ